MRDNRRLLLGAGLLWLLTASGPRGQEARNAGRLLRTFQGHSKAVNNVAFSPDGEPTWVCWTTRPA
jgi:WD40 repeat protein